jgi:hypothetical protein
MVSISLQILCDPLQKPHLSFVKAVCLLLLFVSCPSLMFLDSINLVKKLHKNNLAVEVGDISNLFCNTTRLKACVKKLFEGDHKEAEPDVKQLWDYMI